MTFSPLTTATSGNGGQHSARAGGVDRIILHHCASTSMSAVLGMMSSGSREVSANYVVGNGGEIVGVVPEERRAWTSGSSSWDGRAITFEIVNETAAPAWRISDAAMNSVARMLADISARYGIPLNRDTVLTHQELHARYGASYATACPGPYLQARVDELIARGTLTPSPAPVLEEEETMNLYFEATANSSPMSDGTSRIWAGEGRKIKSRDAEGREFEATYSGVWERAQDGTVRRLFAQEWPAIRAAIEASGRKVPLAQVHGNAIEQMYLVARTEPTL